MKTRPYNQTRRAEAAAATAARVIEAGSQLFLEGGEIPTLDAVSERAGVSVQTILRRFGSKEGLLAAAFEAKEGEVVEQRDEAPVGDIDGAVRNLGQHYAERADLALRLQVIEGNSEAAARAANRARAVHRAWVERVFAPLLEGRSGSAHRRCIVQLIAVTDVQVWKILHRDLGLSPAETEAAIGDLVRRVLHPVGGT